MSRLYRIFSLVRTLAAVAVLALTLTLVGGVSAAPAPTGGSPVEVQQAVQHDVSPPLRDMNAAPNLPTIHGDKPLRLLP